MRNPRATLTLVVLLVLGFGGGAVIAKMISSQRVVRAQAPLPPPPPPEALTDLENSLAGVAKFAKPSVVHITTRSGGVGSGIIVDKAGTLLTNHHVVRGAKEIFVMLHDGRSMRARLVGTDPQTDLAVIRLESPPPDLVEAQLGDSDAVQVGHFVLAVGSPYGLHHTVTFGIVSAKGRRARLIHYEDYIQTTADIHPGNSGGPLVDLQGQVIAINAAMVVDPEASEEEKRRGGTGIGFAIPINLVKWVMKQIIEEGVVRRGFLGISVLDFGEANARRLGFESLKHLIQELGIREPRGALVKNVYEGYPAAEANLVMGDVITHLNDEPVRDSADLIFKVGKTRPGETIRVRYIRAGQIEKVIPLAVSEKPRDGVYLKPSKR